MSAKAKLLWTASILCSLAAVTPAAAQQTVPEPSETPPATEVPSTQETPSTSVADSTQPETQVTEEEIVVTGVRASLQGAQDIKRRSTQVVDSIVAEDIGKLPDNTVSDALQRVTGIQVQRGNGEAVQVLIRGLPRIQSLVNGREVFTGTGRGVSLQDIPAELVAGIDVYKTTTPELIEGSTSGLIDIRFRRPLDFSGMELAGGLRGIYGDQVGKWSYIASGLASNRWETASGQQFGVLVGASFNKRNYEDQTAFNFGWQNFEAPTAQPFIMPLTVGGINNVGKRERPAGNVSVQWRPNSNLELHADGFFTGFREDFDVNFLIGIPIAGGRSNFVRAEGTDFAESVTSENNFTLTSKQAFKRKTDGYQFAAGGSWETGASTLSTDVTYNKSKVRSRALILDTFFTAPRIDYQFNRNGTPRVDIQGIDLTDPANFTLTTLFDNTDHSDSQQIAWRGDLLHEFAPGGGLQNLKAGVRFARRLGDSGGSNPSPLPIRPEIPASSLDGFFTISPGGLFDGKLGVNRFGLADSDYLYGNIDEIRALANQTGSEPTDDPNRVFDLEERTWAAYGQLGYAFDLGALPIDGIVGARIVNTSAELSGFQVASGGGGLIVTPIAGEQDYTDFLPSLSARARLRDNLQARLVLGKAITRPEFLELNPAATLQRAGNTTGGTGTGGNPLLDRIKTTNFDATLEWYFSRTGSLTLAGFRRNLDGYIVVFAAPEIFQEGGQDITYTISRPRNTGKGKLQGIEVAYQQFFDSLPGALSGFGAQANFTYSDSRFRDPFAGSQRIPQVSKYSYNLVAIYEKYGFSGRLAYNWRSSFTDSYIDFFGENDDRDAITVDSLAFLDFSASYQFNDNITFTVDATNLLDETYRDQFGSDGVTPRDTRAYDRTYGAGIRFRF